MLAGHRAGGRRGGKGVYALGLCPGFVPEFVPWETHTALPALSFLLQEASAASPGDRTILTVLYLILWSSSSQLSDALGTRSLLLLSLNLLLGQPSCPLFKSLIVCAAKCFYYIEKPCLLKVFVVFSRYLWFFQGKAHIYRKSYFRLKGMLKDPSKMRI